MTDVRGKAKNDNHVTNMAKPNVIFSWRKGYYEKFLSNEEAG